MLDIIDQLDREVFLFLNGLHSETWDSIMYWITNRPIWTPFYAFLGGLVIWHFRWRSIYILITIGLMIWACDQFSSGFMKPFAGRLRPCHNPEIQHLVHLIKGCKAQFGFVSSHASNTFCIATFMWLIFRNKLKYIWLLFIWATIVSYSRIYAGVHYPGDVIGGAFIGIVIAIIFFNTYKLVSTKYELPLLGGD